MKNRIKNINKYIRADLDRALIVALVFSLPFERLPTFELYNVTVRFSLAIGLIIIIRTLYLLFSKKLKFNLKSYHKVIILFLVWIMLLIPESINIKRAVEVVAFTGFTIALALSVSQLFKSKYIKPIIYSIIISSLFVAAFGLYQYFGDIFGLPISVTGLRDRYTWSVFGFPRIQSTALEPLYLASYIFLPFSVALMLTIIKNKILSIKQSSILLFIYSFIIFLTVSRGGAYGLVAIVVLTALFSVFHKLSSPKKIILAIVLIIAGSLASLVLINYLNKPPSDFTAGKSGAGAYIKHIADTGLEGGDLRAQSRSVAISLIDSNKSSLVVGIGPGQFGPYVQNNTSIQGNWTIINNLTLELLLETGLIGLGLVLAFFVMIVLNGLKLAQTLKDKNTIIFLLVLCAFFIGQAIQYQTYSTLYIVHIWVAAGLLMGAIINGKKYQA